MPVKMTKKAINDLLVAERKKSLEKQKNSKFMNRTRSIYNGQVARAKEEGKGVPYNLEEFRILVKKWVGANCPYCEKKLTINNLTADHGIPISRQGSYGLDNNIICCQNCNFQKGVLTDTEFRDFLEWTEQYLAPSAADNMKKRLTTGGKWLAKSF